MEKRNKIIIVICLLFSLFMITGCKKQEEEISIIKKEFESLNKDYRKVELDNNNVFVLSSEEEFDLLIEDKESFVVLYGDYKDNYTRSVISLIDEVSKYQGISKVYFINRENDIPLLSGYIDGLLSGSSNCISGLQIDSDIELSEKMIKESKEKITGVIEPVSIKINSCDINNNGC